MKMKVQSTAMLILILSMVLAACGGGKENNGGNSGGSASPAPSGTASAPAGGDKVTVTVTSWRAESSEQQFYKKLQEELNKTSPEIVIDYQPVKATEYNTTLNLNLNTGTAADIIHLRPYAGGKAVADAGYLDPIDGLTGLDKFTPAQLAAAQGSDGKQYGVPYMLSSTQILYNKEIFEKNGLQVPQTWDEFIQTAEKLKAASVTPLAFGSKEGWVLSLMHGAVGPQFYGGTEFVDKFLAGEAKLDSPEYIRSIQAMKDLQPYFPANFEGLGMEDIRTLFTTGQTGMVINGHFEIASILGLNPDLQIGVFPVPPVEAGGKGSVSTWVDGSFALNKSAKNKEAARKVLEFMTTEAYGNLILDHTKSPSPIPGTSTNDALVNEIAQLSGTNATPYLAVTALNNGNPTTKSTLENSLQAMYLGKLTPEQVAAEVQKSVDTWFNK